MSYIFRCLTGILISCLLIGCCMIDARDSKQPSVSEVESLVRELSKGTPRSEVEVLLRTNQVEYGWSESEQSLHAIIRGVERKGLVRKDLTMVFFFDSEGRLIKKKVDPAYTGP